jgi:hypothetical protein
MADVTWIGKLIQDFGVLGAFIAALLLFYRLADKWAGQFLGVLRDQAKATVQQAEATAQLAATVKDTQTDQRDILIAVRVLADRIDAQRTCLAAIEQGCRERGCAQ